MDTCSRASAHHRLGCCYSNRSYASAHPIDGAGGSMFRGCPCVRACIQAWGRRHYPTGFPLTASFFPSFCRHFSRLLYNPTCGTYLQSSARAKHFYHTAGSDWTGVYRIIECTRCGWRWGQPSARCVGGAGPRSVARWFIPQLHPAGWRATWRDRWLQSTSLSASIIYRVSSVPSTTTHTVPAALLGPIVCWYGPWNCLPSAAGPSRSPDPPCRTTWYLPRLC